MSTFITPEVQAKRAANLKETEEKMETLRRSEISRFFEEGIPEFCEEVREAAINEYLAKGELPDAICVYDHYHRITSAVANSPKCREALLEKLQSLEDKIHGVELRYTESSPWVATPDPCIVVYFSNNQE
jgi:hypothetical protein